MLPVSITGDRTEKKKRLTRHNKSCRYITEKDRFHRLSFLFTEDFSVDASAGPGRQLPRGAGREFESSVKKKQASYILTCLERKTRLELATPTLARHISQRSSILDISVSQRDNAPLFSWYSLQVQL